MVPHTDLEEKQLLGAMLHSQAARDAALAELQSAAFRNPQHRTVFDAIAELARSGRQVDLVSVAEQLGVKGILTLEKEYVSLADIWVNASADVSVSALIQRLQ